MTAPPPPGGSYTPPPNSPGPYPGAQPGQPPWGPPQPGWTPPPKRSNAWRWVLGAVALVAIVGVTVAITLSVGGRGSGDSSPTAGPPTSGSSSGSEVASTNDIGPANVVTEDPTCAASKPILDMLESQERNGWDRRDPSIPAMAWTPAVRAQFEAAGAAQRSAADQMVALARLTPHRVMRELYEQFIAYSRAYADRIASYVQTDDYLAQVATNAANAVSRICGAIEYGSAAARAPLVQPLATSPEVMPSGDPSDPRRFLTEIDPVCGDWAAVESQFQNDTRDWLASDPAIPASQWTPQQRAINDAVAPVMRKFADELEAFGIRSNNPTLRDFAVLSAQYRRAYVESLPSYTPSDEYLATSAVMSSGVVQAACLTVGG